MSRRECECDACDWCRRWHGDPAFRRGVLAKFNKARAARTGCVHLGPAIRDEGQPCLLKLRRCAEFGTCTLLKCQDCERYEAADAPPRNPAAG
jgi:hypothetical protein